MCFVCITGEWKLMCAFYITSISKVTKLSKKYQTLNENMHTFL